MKIIECTQCGSNELSVRDGLATCAYCRAQFASQAADGSAMETSVGVLDDVQRLLQKCEDDPSNRRRYASLILDIDPTNPKAQGYLR